MDDDMKLFRNEAAQKKATKRRIIIIASVFIVVAAVLAFVMQSIFRDDDIASVVAARGRYSVFAEPQLARIYDCNLNPLNGLTVKYEAVINPGDDTAITAIPYIADRDRYYQKISGNLPFLCEVERYEKYPDNLTVFETARRTGKDQLAPHIIGYRSDGIGVAGIEKSYDDFFRANSVRSWMKFNVDAVGGVLGGLDNEIFIAEENKAGVITTLDADIQRISEEAFKRSGYKKGAVIIMDIKTGEIKSCASFPAFDPSDISGSLDSEDSPFINRAFSAYGVGSVFKLVTAAAALEEGISDEYTYVCAGTVNIRGQDFNCHKWGGHGEIDMRTAIVESCNPYFINLAKYIGNNKFIETAKKLGFGEGTELCADIFSSAGNLQTSDDIKIEAELANMSFGQGKLTATPLQICRMTAIIANFGMDVTPKLIKGIIGADGETTFADYGGAGERILSFKTASKLRSFASDAVNTGNSLAKPINTSAAGKTSTAQTWRFDEQGNEFLNCWFTGYFPSSSPKYAVTILVEEGETGNISSGPIFKEIAEEVTNLK